MRAFFFGIEYYYWRLGIGKMNKKLEAKKKFVDSEQ